VVNVACLEDPIAADVFGPYGWFGTRGLGFAAWHALILVESVAPNSLPIPILTDRLGSLADRALDPLEDTGLVLCDGGNCRRGPSTLQQVARTLRTLGSKTRRRARHAAERRRYRAELLKRRRDSADTASPHVGKYVSQLWDCVTRSGESPVARSEPARAKAPPRAGTLCRRPMACCGAPVVAVPSRGHGRRSAVARGDAARRSRRDVRWSGLVVMLGTSCCMTLEQSIGFHPRTFRGSCEPWSGSTQRYESESATSSFGRAHRHDEGTE